MGTRNRVKETDDIKKLKEEFNMVSQEFRDKITRKFFEETDAEMVNKDLNGYDKKKGKSFAELNVEFAMNNYNFINFLNREKKILASTRRMIDEFQEYIKFESNLLINPDTKEPLYKEDIKRIAMVDVGMSLRQFERTYKELLDYKILKSVNKDSKRLLKECIYFITPYLCFKGKVIEHTLIDLFNAH